MTETAWKFLKWIGVHDAWLVDETDVWNISLDGKNRTFMYSEELYNYWVEHEV